MSLYTITDKLGACVILNIESYKNDTHKRRYGTECDNSLIAKTFTAFGYDVHQMQDPTEKDIKTQMKKILDTDHSESSSFICFILSHGTSKNKIITHDNIHMDLNDIIMLSDVSDLHGKPKIFVMQTCRGGGEDRGVEATTGEDMNALQIKNIKFDAMVPVANKPDFLLIFATPPGYLSYRDLTGTVFIQMFCHLLEEHRHKATVCALLQRLILTISCIPFKVKDKTGWFLQVPYFSSTLRKSLILHPSASSGDYRLKATFNTIKYSRVDIVRRKIVRLLQAVEGIDADGVQFHSSGKSLYHKYLLEESSGCYDLSIDRLRYCLIINKTTDGAFLKAEQDGNEIQNTMESLKFDLHISKGENSWEEKFEQCMANHGRLIGCFFCFIQMNETDHIPDNKFLTEIIGAVKNKTCLLHKPKIIIIQPYDQNEDAVTDDSSHTIEPWLSLPVRYSKESDILIVQTMPVRRAKRSFIEMFCKTYLEYAAQVPIMGVLERIMPAKHHEDLQSLRPVVCSTMRKNLLITDYFHVVSYKTDNLKQEEELCEELEHVAFELEERIKEINTTTGFSHSQDLLRGEDDSDLIIVRDRFQSGTP